MRLFKKLSNRIGYLDAADRALVQKAFDFAVKAHQHQKRHSGEAYITHPVAVACILAERKFDVHTLAAALLHDVIEDSEYTRDDLAREISDEVANIVEGVSKLTKIEFKSRVEAQAENFRKMILAMIKDIRVILVKLADRLHNMRTLGPLRPDKKRRIAQETLEIYAPIARRLGMRQVCVELEELGFAGKHPVRQRILTNQIAKLRGDRQRFLDMIHHAFQEALVKSGLPTCQIIGREKHLYSMYRKMQQKSLPFQKVMDIYAFRIIVDHVDTCYRVLGLLHSLYKPVPERFKDYIAIPKANGYQSLHTTLFGPFGMPIEVQIRTAKMDDQANNGVAAHWMYKLKPQTTHEPVTQQAQQGQTQSWLKTLSELQSSAGSSLEFIESVKDDLIPDEIYVFTPKGKIMSLPAGATVVDFAYAVHTDIGNSCVSALVDQKKVQLSDVLTSGQTVKVTVSQDAEPDSAWLDFVVTSKARSGIRHCLKSRGMGEAICLGSSMLSRALADFVLSTDSVQSHAWERLLDDFGFSQRDELYAEIGLGHYAPALVARSLARLNEHYEQQGQLHTEAALSAQDFLVGAESHAAFFASCCCPIPGDEIVGVFEQDKSLAVHYANCSALQKRWRRAEQYVELKWQEEVAGNFHVRVLCDIQDQFAALADVLVMVGRERGAVKDAVVLERGRDQVSVLLHLEVASQAHLQRIIHVLLQMPVVLKALRH